MPNATERANARTAPAASVHDFHKRLGKAYFGLESDFYDLRNMAGIAQTLFDDMVLTENKDGFRTIQMSDCEFEQLQFAIYRTSHMADGLVEFFLETTALKPLADADRDEPDPVLAIVAKVRAAWDRLGEVINETNSFNDPLVHDADRGFKAAHDELLKTAPTTLAGARAVIAWLVEFDEPNVPDTSGEYLRILIRSPIFAQEEAA